MVLVNVQENLILDEISSHLIGTLLQNENLQRGI